MIAKVTKIAEFKLVRLPSWPNEPTEYATILLLKFCNKVLAVRKGEDKVGMLLGKFYNNTAEGMYMVQHLKGYVRLEKLDGAVVKHQHQRGTANSMSGHSTWTKIWFKDGTTEEFRN